MSGVLVDTSVWVDHFKHGNVKLVQLLEVDCVLTHPLIVGEIACGTPPNRVQTISDLSGLQRTQQASIGEVIELIERERLYGSGCGLVDVMLLASTLITPGAKLWTMDKRLGALAVKFDVAHHGGTH